MVNRLCGSLNVGGIGSSRVLFLFMPVRASAHFRSFYSSVAEMMPSLSCVKTVDKSVIINQDVNSVC
jgi:hypothetical protein